MDVDYFKVRQKGWKTRFLGVARDQFTETIKNN